MESVKKIPTVFMRRRDGDRTIYDEVNPPCAWVLAGEGIPTRKWDGTCCLVRDGRLYKRLDLKGGRFQPPDFELVEDDPVTGHRFGWTPVGDGPDDRWHREGFKNSGGCSLRDGTYELVGPKVNGGRDGFRSHVLVPHGKEELPEHERSFLGIRVFLLNTEPPFEGIVYWHPDGRKAKIKRRDYGLSW